MQTEIELREDGGPHELNIDGKKPETYHEEALKEAYRKLIAGLVKRSRSGVKRQDFANSRISVFSS